MSRGWVPKNKINPETRLEGQVSSNGLFVYFTFIKLNLFIILFI